MRLLGLTFLALVLTASPAAADRGGGRGHGGHGGKHFRDHRGGGGHWHKHRGKRGHGRIKVVRGRYVFPGGVVRVYRQPVVRAYYNPRIRPVAIVEHYDPVPGYVWVGGRWYWGGRRWIWSPGYWDMDGGVEVQAGFSAGVVIR